MLVVDEEEQIVNLEKIILENLGYSVQSFIEPEEALSFYENNFHNFDLVITDMTMPIMTGAELSQKILNINPKQKIIICSGFSDLMNRKQALELGVKDYILKPVVKHELARSVRDVIDCLSV